jgi:predicted permease
MIDAGFRQSGILEVDLDLTRQKIPIERRWPVKRELIARMQSIPGVDGAAHTTIVPLSGSGWSQAVVIGQELRDPSLLTSVSPGYFHTMQIQIVAGRDFDFHDTLASPRVAVVNQAFARQYFSGLNPIGKTFRLKSGAGEKADPAFEIIGEVKDSKYLDIKESFVPIAYFSEDQDREPDSYAAILVRSNAPLATLISALKRTIREFSPDVGFDFKVFQAQIQESLLRERLMATLSGFFGLLAVVLATIGLYGVISYTAARRRNEIGIRMALGAGRREVIGLILREAGMLVAIGLAVGTMVALATATAATSMLYGLKPHDPTTLILAIAVLAVVAAFASYVPARRAASMDPMETLR